MGFLDFLKPVDDSIDINEAAARLHTDSGAVMIDVRDPGEFMMGHVPGAVNLPLSKIQYIEEKAPDMSKPVFVYCMTGMRSRRAARYLRSMGFREVKNAGAISDYRGELVRE